MVEVTKPEIVKRCCSKCGEEKNPDRIVKNRNICKDCCNKKKKETLDNKVVEPTEQRTCTGCNIVKCVTLFIRKESTRCKDCNNFNRRKQYEEKEEVRIRKITDATNHKKKKKAIRDEIKLAELTKLEEEIGQDNTICKYCNEVKAKTHFRHNRLKCKDCERDDPIDKLKRYVRSRIHSCLKGNKTKHTHEYLGCKPPEYIKWLLSNTNNFTLDNHGQVWHIDHVIPLSKFNVENDEECSIAFNWRNTMPLLAKENLSKNNKILKPQIEQHLKNLISYHIENSIELPQIYIDLFAKHLAAGNPLEP
uniref:Uncharacterized protein n=1 Tax=viral metagenome TaxID=1070528 RepID=A0A6C0IHH7_9ZZZZ